MSARRAGLTAVLRHRTFARLALSHGAATVAQLVVTLAVGVEVLERTGSGWWLSATLALGTAPYAVCSGVAGVVADRWSRSRVLAWSAGVRATLVAAIAVAVALEAPVPVLVALCALVAVAATPAYPALAAVTPQCVDDDALPAANAVVTCVENLTWIAGPGVFGALALLGLGAPVQAGVAAALLALAAALAAGGRTPQPVREPADAGWRAWVAGLHLVARVALLRRGMGLAVLDNFLYGYLVVAVVLLVHDSAGGSEGVGRLTVALAVGAAAVLPVVGRAASGGRVEGTAHAALGAFVGCVLLLGLVGPGPVAVALVVLAGAATLAAEVAAVTLLQRSCAEAVLARLFGVYDQLNVGAIALGSALAAPLAAWLGAGWAMVAVAAACGVAQVGLSLLALSARGRPAPVHVPAQVRREVQRDVSRAPAAAG